MADLIESAYEDCGSIPNSNHLVHIEELEADRQSVKDARATILEMRNHQMRSRHSMKTRAAIVETLNEERALVTCDFAQKVLPRTFYETQTEYFGRRGMSYVYLDSKL